MGIRSAAKHASSAFVSSISSCWSLVEEVSPNLQLNPDVDQAITHLNSVLIAEEEDMGIIESVAMTMKQKELSTLVDNAVKRKLLGLTAQSTRDLARLQSVSLPHAGDWLTVVPSPSLGLNLRPAEFRTVCLYRLGMPIFTTDGPCIACDHGTSDRFGDHAVGCASQGERIARHNHLRDALYHTAQSANMGPLREERALLPGGNGERPADVLLPNAAGGRHQAIDVCVVSSLQAQLVDRAAVEPGHALAHRYHQKMTKYSDACLAEGIVFTPAPFEVLGGVHEATASLIQRLGQALARASGQEEGTVTRHLFGHMSILLQKGNASLILSRIPNHPPPNIDGNL